MYPNPEASVWGRISDVRLTKGFAVGFGLRGTTLDTTHVTASWTDRPPIDTHNPEKERRSAWKMFPLKRNIIWTDIFGGFMMFHVSFVGV